MTAESTPRPSPTALSVAELARLLSAAGGRRITAELIQADVDAGAPTHTDGTVNLVHYAAWLVKQASGSGLQASGMEEPHTRPSCSLEPEARGLRPGGPHD